MYVSQLPQHKQAQIKSALIAHALENRLFTTEADLIEWVEEGLCSKVSDLDCIDLTNII